MRDGFVKVAAATPKIRVADCEYNTDRIIELIKECEDKKVNLVVFPELCITGYTCGDLFQQELLLNSAKKELLRIVRVTKGLEIVCVVGLPYMVNNKLYNVAAVIEDGVIKGMVPKTYIANYSEFYEKRYFASGKDLDYWEDNSDLCYSYGIKCNQIFRHIYIKDFSFAIEICEDLWSVNPPSNNHALAGANIIVNLSASDEMVGKKNYRRELVKNQSARLISGYIYASAGNGESTTDVVYGGHNMIAENGSVLAESKMYENELIISEIDCKRLVADRRHNMSYTNISTDEYEENEIGFYRSSYFEDDNENDESNIEENIENDEIYDEDIARRKMFENYETELTRYIDKAPFVPSDKQNRDERCKEILDIQMMGLVKRLEHTNCKCAVIGISGGLDSTLALLVTVRAFDKLDIPRENIMAITMPCFGTTDRTYNNAIELSKELGATVKEINIKEAVKVHFADIGQDMDKHDITYENGQARERTQILMDMANKCGGMVIGTGDMSELALGWATYNGDHMSMYGVNCSVPKTLVRYLVGYYAENVEKNKLRDVLMDILDTPVSPELLPPSNGKIAQKTEDIVGPYELHDFFLYNILRFGFEPRKVYRLAKIAFADEYSHEEIYKWLTTFYRRFFAQQFKRSCIPDGPKVGSITLSPRGELRMPSDACATLWLKQLEEIK